MRELIRIQESKNGIIVSARELHSYLKVKTDFSNWCKRMFNYGLENNIDYTLVKIGEGNAHNKIDYALTIDAAKEISMLQRSDKGKLARKYFIDCEKKLKSIVIPSYQIENTIERAKRWIEEQQKTLMLEEENKKLQFRSDFVDVVFETDGLFTMEEVAKILKLPFGRNTMLKELRTKKVFLESNTPKQNLINSGYFKVSEQIIDSGKFKKLVSTTYATSKGVGYIHKIFKTI